MNTQPVSRRSSSSGRWRRSSRDRNSISEPSSGVRAALPLEVEIARQARRRRTVFSLGFLVLLPLILVGAFSLAGPSDAQPGQTNLVDLGTAGAVNFMIFAIFSSVSFLLVVIVALFCGDTIASEANWSSLRYLLAAPVPRGRLLRQKLTVGLLYSLFAVVLLPVWALIVGRLAYGWGPVRTPLGDTYSAGSGVARVALALAYIAIWMLMVGTLAFWLSTVTDNPLGAVGGAVGAVILSNILDAITALGSLREILPTHYQYAWTDTLVIPVQYDAMIKGAAGALAYSAVFTVLAWRHFANKDIVS